MWGSVAGQAVMSMTLFACKLMCIFVWKNISQTSQKFSVKSSLSFVWFRVTGNQKSMTYVYMWTLVERSVNSEATWQRLLRESLSITKTEHAMYSGWRYLHNRVLHRRPVVPKYVYRTKFIELFRPWCMPNNVMLHLQQKKSFYKARRWTSDL